MSPLIKVFSQSLDKANDSHTERHKTEALCQCKHFSQLPISNKLDTTCSQYTHKLRVNLSKEQSMSLFGNLTVPFHQRPWDHILSCESLHTFLCNEKVLSFLAFVLLLS